MDVAFTEPRMQKEKVISFFLHFPGVYAIPENGNAFLHRRNPCLRQGFLNYIYKIKCTYLSFPDALTSLFCPHYGHSHAHNVRFFPSMERTVTQPLPESCAV